MQAGQGAVVEAGAHLPRVHEVAVGVVVAEEQRAEPDAGALRVGVAADHELLRVLALELEPVLGCGRPGRGRRRAWRPALPSRRVQACSPEGLAVPARSSVNRSGSRKSTELGEQPLALGERQRPGVTAVRVEHVEQVVVHRDIVEQLLRRDWRRRAAAAAARTASARRRTRRSRRPPPGRRAAGRPVRAAISGKVVVISCLLRLFKLTPSGPQKARQRSPSSLRSKIHSGTEKRSWVRVASCGSTQDGSAAARSVFDAIVILPVVRRTGT